MEQKAQQQQIKQIYKMEREKKTQHSTHSHTPKYIHSNTERMNKQTNSNRPDLYFIKVKAKRRNENKMWEKSAKQHSK